MNFELRTGVAPQSDNSLDGLENYSVLREIKKMGSSVIYVAICKRGRLRNRNVALKKISTTSFDKFYIERLVSSASLHQSLHHPSIVSLFSAFTAQSFRCNILELCSKGTLCDFLFHRTSSLSESELRNILKSLVDALLYLQKELVIHRDIRASNILLTSEYRIKLSGFGLAIRLPTSSSSSIDFFEAPTHAAPEILSRSPYAFASDVWSLGYLINNLMGTPSATKSFELADEVKHAAHNHLRESSDEFKDLLSKLLDIHPSERIVVQDVLQHPFLNSALPSHNLLPKLSNTSKDTPTRGVSTSSLSAKLNKKSLLDHKLIQTTNETALQKSKHILHDIQHADLRRLLTQEASLKSIPNFGARRIVSDPLPRNNKATLTSEFAILQSKRRISSDFPSSYTTNLEYPGSIEVPVNEPLNVLREASTHPHIPSPAPFKTLDSDHLCEEAKSPLPDTSQDYSDQERLSGSPSPVTLAVGTTRPEPFTTTCLSPQTHKMAHGQLTVLPSSSLLVDFREGERRRGRKGNEVFIVEPDGGKIKIYDAPHLSTPCCLVEHIAMYSIDDLPSTYWQQYNDAGRVVEKCKQRIPKLILYGLEAKCTLASNVPDADIELLFPCPTTQTQKRRGSKNSRSAEFAGSNMRIRLSRRCHTIEVARTSPKKGPDKTGEWTKKIMTFHRDADGRVVTQAVNLVDAEMRGIEVALEFLKLCEAVESQLEGGISLTPTFLENDSRKLLPARDNASVRPLPLGGTDCSNVGATISSETRTIFKVISPSTTAALSLVDVPPRPPKLAGSRSKLNKENIPPTRRPSLFSTSGSRTSRKENLPSWSHIDFPSSSGVSNAALQTRFIPSVGWCVRHGSRVSQGGRYRIMFLDGSALEVDVDEEWVELHKKGGIQSRHLIRDCHMKQEISERMAIFQDFVSMFDDDTD